MPHREFVIVLRPLTGIWTHEVTQIMTTSRDRTQWTEVDFPELSWHDCEIHSITIDQEGEWQSDLVLDIDFVTEWLCGADKSCLFKVAPATLRFINVDNLRIDVSLHFKQPIEINSIERSELPKKGINNYHWSLKIHKHPYDDGDRENLIEFDATSFMQELTGQPLETESLSLTRAERDQSKKNWPTKL